MSKTLLLADDSVTIQKVVGISFASEDVQLVTVDNGDDAILKAREVRPDVVLADVVMPGKNGYEVCEALKADPELRHVPVILLTGTFEAFDEERARQAGASGHVAKPFEAQTLVDEVKRLFSQPAPSAPEPVAPAPAPVVQEPALDAAAPADESFDFFDDDLNDLAPPPSTPRPADTAPPNTFDLAREADFVFGDEAPPAVDPSIPSFDEAGIPGDRTVAILPDEDPMDLPPAAPEPLVAPPPSGAPDALAPMPSAMEPLRSAPEPAPLSAEPMPSPLEPMAVSPEPMPSAPEPPPLPPEPVSSSMEPMPAPPPAPRTAAPSPPEPLSPAANPPAPVPQAAPVVQQTPGDTAPRVPEPPTPPASFDFDLGAPPASGTGIDARSIAQEAVVDPLGVSGFAISSSDLDEPAAPPPANLADTAPRVLDPLPPPLEAEPIDDAEPMDEIARVGEPADEPVPSEPAPGTSVSGSEPASDMSSALDALAPQLREQLHDTLEKIAWESFSDVTERIVRQAVERVEQIAWEVIPHMAETLVREEIRRMKGEK